MPPPPAEADPAWQTSGTAQPPAPTETAQQHFERLDLFTTEEVQWLIRMTFGLTMVFDTNIVE